MESNKYTNLQLSSLFILRLLIGWHILYEGISKLLMPDWSSAGFLRESQWILSGFAQWILSDNNILLIVDFLNTWGLIAIGVGLILGIFTRLSAIAGAGLLLLYYFNNAPVIGIEYTFPSEGQNLIVNKTLIEVAALVVLAVFTTGQKFGLDILVSKFKYNKAKA